MSTASVYFTLRRADGMHNVKHIKRGLDKLPGVTSVSYSDQRNQVAVDYDPTGVGQDRIQNRLEQMGYEVIETRSDRHST